MKIDDREAVIHYASLDREIAVAKAKAEAAKKKAARLKGKPRRK